MIENETFINVFEGATTGIDQDLFDQNSTRAMAITCLLEDRADGFAAMKEGYLCTIHISYDETGSVTTSRIDLTAEAESDARIENADRREQSRDYERLISSPYR